MCKLMARSVICFLLFTAADANATPISNTTIPGVRSTMEPIHEFSGTGLAISPLGPHYRTANSDDPVTHAGSELAPVTLSEELTGNSGTLYEPPTASWVTAPQFAVSLSEILPTISVSERNAVRKNLNVGIITRLSTYVAAWLSPVPEPISLLLFGSSLLGVAGIIRRPTRSADHSQHEPANPPMSPSYRRTSRNALRVQE